jgi:hypothetical protein
MLGLNDVYEMCVFFFLLDFQPVPAGGSLDRDRALSPNNTFDSGISSPPRPFCRCEEYSLRSLDLESHLSLMKRQAQIALDKASKSHGLMKQVSNLEDEVSSLVERITHFEECDSFLIGIIEFVCEMLLCKFLGSLFSLLLPWIAAC